MEDTPIHPLAESIPEMNHSQFAELKEDIRANSLRDAITLLDGKILDGRHRYRACVELGIDPVYEEFPGGDPEAFVISRNLKRRHLTSDQQRALADVRRKKVAEMRQQGMSTRTIADELDVSEKTVRDDLGKSGAYHSAPEPPNPESKPAQTPAPPKVTGRDGKQYPATRPTPVPKRPTRPDPKLLESIRQKLIGEIQRIRNECEKHGWNEPNELLKLAQDSLKG